MRGWRSGLLRCPITGSAEGFFRIGRIFASGPVHLRNPALANAYLAQAVPMGPPWRDRLFRRNGSLCAAGRRLQQAGTRRGRRTSDLDGYLSALSPARRRVAELIRRHAASYGIDVRVALAIALAESNLNAEAVSPKNAQGVMQLIPDTQVRFGVKNPFDPEANIKGGLAYLKWLKARFDGDWSLIAAAYNAGEGAVEKHDDIPPVARPKAM